MEKIIEEKVKNYLDEKKGKDERQCNLIFHNVPESKSGDTDVRKEEDQTQVHRILQHLDVQISPSDIEQAVRLGKKTDGQERPRLLKIKLSRVEPKKQTLSRAKKLKDSKNECYNSVFISPDLTFQEREENRRLRNDLKARRDNGEENIIIRNGKIVKVSQSFRTQYTTNGAGS